MSKHIVSLLAAASMTAAATAGSVSIREIARVELTADMFGGDSATGQIGGSVAWDGSNLFVGGFQGGSSSTGTVGIVRIDDALNAPAMGAQFGIKSAGTFRGYSGLDIRDGVLAAAFDSGSSVLGGLSTYDLGGNLISEREWRGGSGVGFDPGFGGQGGGVSSLTFGSGFLRTFETNNLGNELYAGSVFTDQGSFYRDLDFNDNNGNVWIREGNNLTKYTRNGLTDYVSNLVFDQDPDADFTNGQNVAVVTDSFTQDFVLFNDRPNANLGQNINDVLKAVGLDGSSLDLDLVFTQGDLNTPDGSGYYDFSYDAASKTLAILDFNSRSVYIFKVPAPGAAALLGLGGLVAARRRR